MKAVAVDEDGNVVARVRLASALSVGPRGQLEHNALSTWWSAPRSALSALGGDLRAMGASGLEAVAVSAMMPSVSPVDEAGRPLGPGLLYGSAGPVGPGDPTSSDEMARLAGRAASACPHAGGYWPAQGVANASLGGGGVVDLASAFAFGSLFNGSKWEDVACGEIGLKAAQLPLVSGWGEAVGEVGDARAHEPGAHEPGARSAGVDGKLRVDLHRIVLGTGSVDGLCEQLVAGAATPGDVLVSLGSTLVVWLCVPGWPENVPAGLWRVPHLAGGMAMVGGASNAGGLWADWADRLLRPAGDPGGWLAGDQGGALAGAPGGGFAGDEGVGDGGAGDEGAGMVGARGRGTISAETLRRGAAGGRDVLLAPDDVPVWWPWARGERVPWHDASLRVGLAGGSLSHGPAHLRRAALEATGFVVRHIVHLAASCGTSPRRYIVSGGGVARPAWLQALAEVLGAPVLPMTLPEGAALGAAFLARMAVGLETSLSDASRWARWAPAVEPRAEWVQAASERYNLWEQGLPALRPPPLGPTSLQQE